MQKQGIPTFSGVILAKLLGLTEARISQLCKDKIIHKNTSGKGYPPTAITAYCDFLRSKKLHMASNTDLGEYDSNYEEIKKQKLIEETEKLRKENLLRDGELVEASFALGLQEEIYLNIKQQFLNLPNKVAPLLVGEENFSIIKSIIQKEVDDILQELSTRKIEQWCKELAIPAKITEQLENLSAA